MASKRKKSSKKLLEATPQPIVDEVIFDEDVNFDPDAPLPARSIVEEPWVWGVSGAVVLGGILWGWNRASIDSLENTSIPVPDSAAEMRKLWDKVNQVDTTNIEQDQKLETIQQQTEALDVVAAQQILADLQGLKGEVVNKVTELNDTTKVLNKYVWMAPTGVAVVIGAMSYPIVRTMLPLVWGSADKRTRNEFGASAPEPVLRDKIKTLSWTRAYEASFTALLVTLGSFYMLDGPSAWGLSRQV